MANYNIDVTFTWDNEDDTKLVVIEVPADTSKDDVIDALTKDHAYLCFYDETDTYGELGRTPETLVNFTCGKHGWKWHELEFDARLVFD